MNVRRDERHGQGRLDVARVRGALGWQRVRIGTSLECTDGRERAKHGQRREDHGVTRARGFGTTAQTFVNLLHPGQLFLVSCLRFLTLMARLHCQKLGLDFKPDVGHI